MKTSRTFKWTVALALALGIGLALALTWEPFAEAALAVAVSHRPLDYSLPFHPAIASADRIVVRADGFNCCRAIDETNRLFEVTDPREVADVRAHIAFKTVTTTNSLREICLCCGAPGMDWYRGKKRLALTALQHGQRVRWKGFSTIRLLGVRVGYGDAPLTAESSQWLRDWLAAHGAGDSEPIMPPPAEAPSPGPDGSPPAP